jgi:hypothetical protein
MRRTPGVPGSLSVVLYLAPIVIDPIAAAAAAAAVARAAPRSRSPASEQSRWCGEKGLANLLLVVELESRSRLV